MGDGGEFRAPMAIAVIGGLIVSTLLSLVFVPSFYVVMDDISRFFGWIFGRFIGPSEDESTWKPLPGDIAHKATATPPLAANTAGSPPRIAAE